MNKNRLGFTLIEITIAVAIVGILAALAIPAMMNAGNGTRAKRFAREIRTAADAFIQYSFEKDGYPPEIPPSLIPEGMAPYLSNFPWAERTVIGGLWDWDYEQHGIKAGVSVYSPSWDDEAMTKVDRIIDDGDLSSGTFRKRSDGYIYIIEE